MDIFRRNDFQSLYELAERLEYLIDILKLKNVEKRLLFDTFRRRDEKSKRMFEKRIPLFKTNNITINDLKYASLILQLSFIVVHRNKVYLIKLQGSKVIIPVFLELGHLTRIKRFCIEILTMKMDNDLLRNEVDVVEVQLLKNFKTSRLVEISPIRIDVRIINHNIMSILNRKTLTVPFDNMVVILSERGFSKAIEITSEETGTLRYFIPHKNPCPRIDMFTFLEAARNFKMKSTLGFVDLINNDTFRMYVYKGDENPIKMYSIHDLSIELSMRENRIKSICDEIYNSQFGYYYYRIENRNKFSHELSFIDFESSVKKEEFTTFEDPRYFNLHEGQNIVENVKIGSEFVEIEFLNETLMVKISEIRKLKHEMLQRMLFQKTSDVKFEMFFSRLEDGFDHLTPDLIRKGEFFIEVIELSTSISERLLQNTFKQKTDKYLEHIRKRSNSDKTKVIFEILCLSPSKVYTNRKLNGEEMEILSNLYPSFCYVRDILIDDGVSEELFIESTLNIDMEVKTLREEFKNFSMNYESKYDDLNINEAFDERIQELEASSIKFRTEIRDLVLNDSIQPMKFEMTDSSTDCKKDKHPLTIFPLIIPKKTTELFPSVSNYENLTATVWSKVAEKFDFEEYLKEDDLMNDSEIFELKNKNIWEKRVRIRKNKLVFPELNYDKVKSFKQLGIILNDEIKKNETAIEYKKWQKRPFSVFTDTTDIDEFINGYNGFLETESFPTIITEISKVTDEKINGRKSYGSDQMEAFRSTEIGTFLDFLGDLMSEISYSFKQYVKKLEMNIKKMKRFPVWIITRPCGIKHPIWFSLLIHGDFQFNTLFRKCKRIDDSSQWHYTEFMSIRESRVGHFLNSLEIMFNTLVSLCLGWNIDTDEFFENPESHMSVRKHFNLCLLIYLDSKQGTSSDFVNLRYYYMELMKGQLSYPTPNPFKIIKKLSTFKRSRLQIWLLKKMKEKGEVMLKELPKLTNRYQKAELDPEQNVHLTEELAVSSAFVMNDKWENLLSLIDNEKFESSHQAIIFSYIGYLHNKDEITNSSDDFGIYEKIVKLEVLMKDLDQESMYRGEVEPKYHVFNAQFVKYGSILFKEYLKRDTEYKEKFSEDFFKEIAYSTVDNMATFKASAPLELERHEKVSDFNGQELRRPKLIERVCEITKFYDDKNRSFYSKLKEFSLPLYRGMKVFLFKKSQIGGTREIFILQAEARLLIYTLETASRKICNYVPFEMLTKGKIKKNWTKRHCVTQKSFMKSSSGKYCSIGNIYASGDCSTWCQNFTMRQFYIMLSEIMPQNLLALFKSILNLVTDKEIYLSKSVRKSFADKPQIKSTSNSINTLKDDWMGVGDGFVIDKNGSFIKNRSNMMQGILHFTSSLYHCMILTTLEKLLNDYVNLYFPSVVIKMSKQVSSDDWGLIISIYLEKSRIMTKTTKIGRKVLKRRFYLMDYEGMGSKEIAVSNLVVQIQKILYAITNKTYQQMGIVVSEKSTFFSYNTVYEFNSNFEVNNSIIAPLIPISYSAVDAKSFMNIESGIYTAQTLRSTCLENGMTLSSVSCIQSSQLFSHYRNLGLNTSSHSSKYASLILKNPAPSLGFFLTEPDALCGIAGLSFVKEKLYKNWTLFEETQEKLNYLCEYIPSEEGYLSQHFTIRQGLGEPFIRFKKFISEMYKLNLDEEDFDPEILYEVFPSINKGKIELSLKSCSIGAEENFIRKTQCSSHIAGVYMLNNPSVIGKFKMKDRKLETGMELLDGSKSDLFKSSLIGFLKMLNSSKGKTKQNLLILNPSFDIFNNVLSSFNASHRYRKPFKLKSRINNVELIKNSTDFLVPLLDCCKSIWFNKEIRISEVPIYQVFASYQRIFPWLKDSYSETLKDGPFGNHSSLYGFLKSHQKRFTRKVSILGSFAMKTSVEETLMSCASMNFYKNFNVLATESERITSDLVELISKLLINNRLPTFLKEDVSKILKESNPIYGKESIQTYVTLNSRFAELAVMQYVTKNPDINSLIRCISLIKLGGILYYTKRQSFDKNSKTRYAGFGICKVFFEGTTAEVYIKDSIVQKIVLNKRSNSKNFFRYINSRSHYENWNLIPGFVYEGLRINKDGLSEDTQLGGVPVEIDPSLVFDMHEKINYYLSVDSRDRIRLHLEDEVTGSKPVILSCQLNKKFLELNSINPQEMSITDFIRKGEKYGKFKFKEICEILMNKDFIAKNFKEIDLMRKAEGLKGYMDEICKEKLFSTERFSMILRRLKIEDSSIKRELSSGSDEDFNFEDLDLNEDDNFLIDEICNTKEDILNEEIINENLDFSDFINDSIADHFIIFLEDSNNALEDTMLKLELMDKVGFLDGFNKARVAMKKTVSAVSTEGIITAWDQIKSGNYEDSEGDVGSQFFTNYMFNGRKPDPVKISSFF